MYDERDWSGQSPEQAAATWRKEGILYVRASSRSVQSEWLNVTQVVVVKHAAAGEIVRVRNVLRGGEEDGAYSRLVCGDELDEPVQSPVSSYRATSSSDCKSKLMSTYRPLMRHRPLSISTYRHCDPLPAMYSLSTAKKRLESKERGIDSSLAKRRLLRLRPDSTTPRRRRSVRTVCLTCVSCQ